MIVEPGHNALMVMGKGGGVLSASGPIRKVRGGRGGGGTTVPSGKMGRGGALYERVYNPPPPPPPSVSAHAFVSSR